MWLSLWNAIGSLHYIGAIATMCLPNIDKLAFTVIFNMNLVFDFLKSKTFHQFRRQTNYFVLHICIRSYDNEFIDLLVNDWQETCVHSCVRRIFYIYLRYVFITWWLWEKKCYCTMFSKFLQFVVDSDHKLNISDVNIAVGLVHAF